MDTSGAAGGQPAGEELSADGIASLLSIARQRISEGDPLQALQAVVLALRATGGEQAVVAALGKAQEIYHSGMQANAATDELSALFAECAIATLPSPASPAGAPQAQAAPVTSEQVEMMDREHGEMMDSSGTSRAPILAESGRLQVVMDASADGSSFVCQQCGGVVSNMRKDEHFAFWCSPPAS